MSEENTEVVVPEVVLPDEAVVLLKDNALEQSDSEKLKQFLVNCMDEAQKYVDMAHTIKVTSIDQKNEIKMARQARLALRDIRCRAENERKRMKANVVAQGKAIDGIANIIKGIIGPAEQYLDEQEKFEERWKAEQKEKLRQARMLALEPYSEVFTVEGMDVASMSDEAFDSLLEGAKLKMEKHKEEQERIEKERIEAERKAEKERQREIKEAQARAEAERIEREKAEAEAKKEREARQKAEEEAQKLRAQAEKERAERERIQKEQAEKERKQREAEELAKRETEEAKRKAEQAPDRDKVLAFVNAVSAVVVPDVSTEAGVAVVEKIAEQHQKYIDWLSKMAGKL